ncbi:MAG: hypothetical protein HWN67_01605 [Candidatus Helarchaeota archaeon]|nr:hypothetical protein [Candidatus Helarchaeota archaeon]
MEDKFRILEEELENIRKRLTKKLYDQIKETKKFQKKVDDLNNLLNKKDKEIKEYKSEINTLRDAFDLLISDWIEELEKRGISQEEILAQRKSFEKVMYWKHGEKY